MVSTFIFAIGLKLTIFFDTTIGIFFSALIACGGRRCCASLLEQYCFGGPDASSAVFLKPKFEMESILEKRSLGSLSIGFCFEEL